MKRIGVALLCACLMAAPAAAAEQSFFQGKVVRITVGFSAG